MDIDNKVTGSSEINELLANMNKEGGFAISILTDRQGLPMAYATTQGYDADRQSAVVAMIQKSATQAGLHLGMTTDEISLNAVDGQRLVCRPFEVNGSLLILAVLTNNRKQSYRRITNNTIRKIAGRWKLYWE